MDEKTPRDVLDGWDILIIDDEADSLVVLSHLLKHYGATVITAEDGERGLELIREHRHALIISDLTMPGIDGWELIEILQADSELAAIPVVALTAHAMIGDREKVIQAGYRNHLTKPLIPATFILDLLWLIREIPELKGRLDEPD